MFKGLKSLVIGVVAGTALGVLFAPKKGEEIRKGFKKEIEKGGTGLETLKETATVMGKDLKSTAEDAYGDLNKNQAFKKAKTQVKKQAQKAKSALKKISKK